LICIQRTGKKRGERRLTGDKIPARCTLEVVDGEAPIIDGGDGVADDVPGVMASSWVRSATSEASCNGGERRPETQAARVSTE
jgi:hypothetical protein